MSESPLKSPNFRKLAAAYLVNEFGTWIGDVALALLVFVRTSSPLATAALFLALRFLPSFAAPSITSWVETIRPDRALPALYLTEAALYSGIAVLASHFSLPGVLALAATDGVLAIVAKAMTRSVNANELGAQRLRAGNAMMNMGVMVSSALGPALAGALVAWRGAGTALAVDALTFVVAAVLLVTTRGLRIESDETITSGGRLRAGLKTIAATPALLGLMVAFGLVMVLSSIAVPVEVVFATRTLHSGDSGYGLLLGAWGVGMIAGGGVFALAREARNGVLLASSVALIAAGYGGLALSPDLLVASLFSAVGGIGNGIGGITAITAIQESIPMKTQSVVMSVFETVNQAGPALGFVLGGVITSLGSARGAYAASSIGVAMVLVGAGGMRAIHYVNRRFRPITEGVRAPE